MKTKHLQPLQLVFQGVNIPQLPQQSPYGPEL